MNNRDKTGSYPAAGAAFRPGAWSILLASLATAAVFLLLPLFGLFAEMRHESLATLPAPEIISAPPMQPAPAKVATRKRPARPLPRLRKRPRMARARQRIQFLKTDIALPMTNLATGIGDFQVDFTLKPPPAEKPAAKASPDFVRLARLDQPPRPVLCMKPIYPRAAKREGIEGFVEVLFTINPAGRVFQIKVVRSAPGELFVAAVRKAIGRWRFTPPQKNGRAVSTRVSQVIQFQVEKNR